MAFYDAPLDFYIWPNLNKHFSKQTNEARVNSETGTVLARAGGVDLEPTAIRKNDALTSWMQGEVGFFNKYRTYYNKDTSSWSIQRNTGTQADPVWVVDFSISSDGTLTDGVGTNLADSNFYITVKHSDDSFINEDTKIVTFNISDFYVTPTSDGTEALVNFRGTSGGGSGTITGGSNLGDEDIFAGVSGNDLTFKGLTQGTGITLSNNATDITITATGGSSGGSGFYGSTVKQVDISTGDVVSFSGIKVFGYDADTFYVIQNEPNTDEVFISAKGVPGATGATGATGAAGSDGADGTDGTDGTDGADGGGIGTYTESISGIEWEVTHNLNSKPLLWSCFDDGDHFIIPEKVDVSNLNTAYFYFNESISGQVILSSGSAASGGGSFYPLVVKQVDEQLGDITSFSGTKVLSFNNAYFYNTQNSPNTDEVLVNFRFTGDEHIPGDLEVGNSDLFVDQNNNKVGIGSKSPGYKLDVVEDAETNIRIKSNANAAASLIIDSGLSSGQNSQIELRDQEFSKWFIRKQNNNDLLIFDQSIPRSIMTFQTGTGRVGINTGAPGTEFHVQGEITSGGKVILKKGIQGFYIPMAEDVASNHPEDGALLKFKQSTGQYTPSSGLHTGNIHLVPPEVGDEVNLFHVGSNQEKIVFDRMDVVLRGFYNNFYFPTVKWNIRAGPNFGVEKDRVFIDDQIVDFSTVNSGGVTIENFYTNTIGDGTNNRWCWLDIVNVEGGVDDFIFSSWFRTED